MSASQNHSGGTTLLRLQISVPRETTEECYNLVLRNLHQALENRLKEQGTLGKHAHSPEIGICRFEKSFISISARGAGDIDTHKFILNSVVTTLGHQYNGVIRNEDSGVMYDQKYFASA